MSEPYANTETRVFRGIDPLNTQKKPKVATTLLDYNFPRQPLLAQDMIKQAKGLLIKEQREQPVDCLDSG